MMTVKTIAFGTVREASFVSSPKAAADSYPAKIKSAERVPLQNLETKVPWSVTLIPTALRKRQETMVLWFYDWCV